MANLKKNNEMARAKTVSLPDWMWEIVEAGGSRSQTIRESLMKDERFKKGNPNGKKTS